MELQGMMIFAAVMIVAIVVVQFVQKHKQHAAWAILGEEMGLEFYPAEESLVGKVNGVDINVHIEVRGSRKNKKVYTVFSSAAADILPVGLAMTRQHLLSAVGKVLGMQDIEVGDSRLDDRFVIRGPFEDETREFLLNGPVRDALLQLSDRHDSLRIMDGSVRFDLKGRISNPNQIRSSIDTLVSCVSQMRSATFVALEESEAQGEKLPETILEEPKAHETPDLLEEPKVVEPTPPAEENLDEKWAVPNSSEADDDVIW